jgi:hypothetical protein
MIKMKNIFLFVLLASCFCSNAQEEKVVDLSINPQLYHQHKHRFNTANKQLESKYFFSPGGDTLELPFVDDFSVYHLKSYDTAPEVFPVVDTVARTLELTDDTLVFYYSDDTALYYTYDTVTHTVDSFFRPSEHIYFVLHNDSFDVSIPTDTIEGWPLFYHNYVFDSNGVVLDSTLAPYDSILYSPYYGVEDTNALWLDNYVFVNDDYPTNKLSIGVATFDGLNEFGLPHNNNSIDNYGSADTLTSRPINLEGFQIADSLYFSFSFQPKGLGDKPEAIDSLILEFKTLGNTWDKIGAWAGSDSVIGNPVFNSDFMVKLENPFYFVSDFQFRFRNLSTITGNNDHWHIDYVYLNENRSIANRSINDVAISYRADDFLTNYTAMPWNQYAGFETKERRDTIFLTIKNNYPFVGSIGDITYRAYEVFTNIPALPAPVPIARDIPANSSYTDTIDVTNLQYNAPPETDSVLINFEYSFTENPTSITTENNIATTSVLFANYFAYDDGTAEKAYGLEGPGLKKFAYEFNLNRPDTLRALQFHFSQINENLLLNELTLVVWREILAGEDTLYIQAGTPFHYIPERNGFTTYVLDTPVAVDTKFYVGWQQLFTQNIQLGLDLNNSATEHMFYYTNGTWKFSAIAGAPMIRPIVGKNIELTGTGIKNPALKEEAFIYPNPAEDVLYLRTPRTTARVEIYNMQGKLIQTLNGTVKEIEISDLEPGMYILRILSGKNEPQSLRFVKM